MKQNWARGVRVLLSLLSRNININKIQNPARASDCQVQLLQFDSGELNEPENLILWTWRRMDVPQVSSTIKKFKSTEFEYISQIMAKRALIGIIAVLIFLSMPLLVSSMEINVHTLAYHKVSIFIFADQEQYLLLGSFLNKEADGLGAVKVTYPGTENKVKITIKIMYGETQLMLEKMGSYPTNAPVYFQLKPGNISYNYRDLEAQAQSDTNEANASNIDTNADNSSESSAEDSNQTGFFENLKNKSLTGLSILKDAVVRHKVIIFSIVGGLFIAVVLVFVVSKARKRKLYGNIPKESASPTISANGSEFDGKKLEEIEGKVKEVMSEITKVRSKQKNISDLRKRIDADKEALEKLEKEDEEE